MNNSYPLVSVAMATYNGARYIREQLDSIIGQTYPNIEIVLVDDGSSDSTMQILEQYRQQYPFISVHRNEVNMGVTPTFEKAISLCKGEYIALSDQDDIWMPEKISVLVKEIGQHDAVYGNSLLVDVQGTSLNKTFSDLMNIQTYYCGSPFLLSNSVPGHAMLMKRSFVEKVLPLPKNIFFDLWLGFCAAGNNGIRYVDQILVHYRQHDANVVGTVKSSNKKKKRTKYDEFDFKLSELKTLAKAPIANEKTKQILSEMIRHFHFGWSIKRSRFFFSHYNEILKSKRKSEFRKKLYCIKMFFKPNF